jgi:hypothetical protein
MKHTVLEQKPEVVVKDITCDICGKSCLTDYGFEYLTMKANWGFMSNKDLEIWEAHICEKCVDDKLVNLISVNFNKKHMF